MAEKAIETGSPEKLIRLLTSLLRQELEHRLEHASRLRDYRPGDVEKAREYVEATLGLEVYSHQLYQAMEEFPTRALTNIITIEQLAPTELWGNLKHCLLQYTDDASQRQPGVAEQVAPHS